LIEIQSHFSPLSIFQGTTFQEDQILNSNQKLFDAIWEYEIIGRQFEQIKNPLSIGVFESSKCYFIVFIKDGKIAIYLWRGSDRSYLKKFEDCGELLMETKFRMEKNSLRGKDNSKSMNTSVLSS